MPDPQQQDKSTSPKPLFDMSKATPLFDMSKAQPLNAEPAIPENYGFTAKNMGAQGKEGIKQLGSSLYTMAKDILSPPGDTESDKLKFLANKYIFDPADREQILAQNAPTAWESIGHSIAQSLPLVGPWAASLGEQAGTGDIGGALSRGGTQIAAAKVADVGAGAAKTAIGMGREAVGGAIHTPEGELTPGAALGSKVVGGAAGGAIGSLFGHEYLGAGAGYKLGPSLMERMFPEPADQVAARQNFLDTKELTEAHEAALQEATRRANTQQIVTQRAMKAEQASRDQLWQARDSMAQDLMNRQKQQDALDAVAVRTQNAAARASREQADNAADLQKEADKAAQDAQDARDAHTKALEDSQKQLDKQHAAYAKTLKAVEDARQQEITMWSKFNQQGESPTQTQPAGDIPQGTSTPFGNPQDLISRTKKIVKPGETPSEEDLKRAGDMTQAPLAKLKLLASWGDELAKNEINRRLRNQ